jgi:hypothetical protein
MGQTERPVFSSDYYGAEVFTAAIGKTIKEVKIVDNSLLFTFDRGYRMRIYDCGQNCCEIRYMTTDDDLSYFAGAKLLGAELKDAPNVPHEWGVHEVQFLEIKTDKGVFAVANHNEHNGFLLRAVALCRIK